MQKRKSFKEPFDCEAQEEIFFTMKVYATKTGDRIDSLKYSIDLHPPFEANTNTIEPYASPLVAQNIGVFERILDNVKDVLNFMANPVNYKHRGKKLERSTGFRLKEQETLAKALELSKGAINHITYEKNSPATLTVGTVIRTTGNGDQKPPPPPPPIK